MARSAITLSKPDTPKPPDYVGAANAQGSANIDAALAGTSLATPNQVNPFGTTSWSNTGYDQAMQDWMAQGQTAGYSQTGGNPAAGTGTQPDAGPNPWDVPEGLPGNSYYNMNPAGTYLAQNLLPDSFSPTSVLGKGGGGQQAPSYTASPEESAYNQWLAGRPDKAKFTNPGDFTLTTGFSPELQALFDRTSHDPLAPADLGQGADTNRQNAEEALYRRATRYLDPQVDQGRTALQARLQDQGIYPGSEAYTYQMSQFDKDTGNQYANARDTAIAGGGSEADRTFRENLAKYQQQLQERELPLQEYSQLKGLLPGANPSAQSVGAAPILDALKQQYGSALQQYGIDASQAGSQTAAGAGVITAILAALLG